MNPTSAEPLWLYLFWITAFPLAGALIFWIIDRLTPPSHRFDEHEFVDGQCECGAVRGWTR